MERLAFDLPDFTRLSWTSDRARQIWQPRLAQISGAWLQVEWRSVVSGIRACCVTEVAPAEYQARARQWVELGLNALPLEMPEPRDGSGSPAYRFVLGSTRSVLGFQDALEAGDHREMGRLLGHPPCCHDAFHDTWVELGLTDTTWPMSLATARPPAGARCIEVATPPETNVLWRWAGIRAVPHLPCRFDCQPSVDLGRELVEVGRRAGHEHEMAWLLEVLSWPVEWSALHGIAEIKTPILKICTRTDATGPKYVVRRHGSAYPEEGARGLGFPYHDRSRPRSVLTTFTNP